MKLYLSGHDNKYELEALSNMFFAPQKVQVVFEETPQSGEDYILAKFTPDKTAKNKAHLHVKVVYEQKTAEENILYTLAADDENNAVEYAFCHSLYKMLSGLLDTQLPWGMLTGIRPVRLVYRCWAQGMDDRAAKNYLEETYFVSGEKAELLIKTAHKEKEIVDLSRPESFSLYISIPFCPSRCNYCSFVSHSVEMAKKLIPDYIRLLKQEIAMTGDIVKKRGLRLETLYFGGGTPTVLTAKELEEIITAVKDAFDLSVLREFTVEAGRPDTITPEKLAMLKRQGVTRISINPQTMNDAVLKTIGRGHTANETKEAYLLAKEAGHTNINMDLIAGLPGDTLESFRSTVESILKLAPENITLHTLTVKRSSKLGQESDAQYAKKRKAIEDMLDFAAGRFSQDGYVPYYLYRQKNTANNMENVGYCQAGKEGYYNIYIMDETHSIIALGAGAVSKIVMPDGKKIERIFNYKYPYEYINRFDEVIRRKEKMAQLLQENFTVAGPGFYGYNKSGTIQ